MPSARKSSAEELARLSPIRCQELDNTEVCTISSGQALTLSSEGGPKFTSKALSEI